MWQSKGREEFTSSLATGGGGCDSRRRKKGESGRGDFRRRRRVRSTPGSSGGARSSPCQAKESTEREGGRSIQSLPCPRRGPIVDRTPLTPQERRGSTAVVTVSFTALGARVQWEWEGTEVQYRGKRGLVCKKCSTVQRIRSVPHVSNPMVHNTRSYHRT